VRSNNGGFVAALASHVRTLDKPIHTPSSATCHDSTMETSTTTGHLFRRRELRLRVPLVGAATLVMGAVAVFLGHMPALIAVVVGIALIATGVVAGRKALVSFDANGVVLRFSKEVAVAFSSLEKVANASGTDIELTLHSGKAILIPLAQLEDTDGAWLKKELRKAVNQRRERVSTAGASPYSIK